MRSPRRSWSIWRATQCGRLGHILSPVTQELNRSPAIRAALNLPTSAIRCTSVDGHRLEGGADTDEAVRSEIGIAEAFLGILSNRSVRSAHVLIELGGRWVLNKHLLPLLAPGTPPSVLGGPLAGKNALRADSEAQLHQMVHEVASVLQVRPEPANVYLQQIRDVKEWKPTADTEQRLVIRPFTPDREVAKNSEQLKIAADLNSAATELLKAAAADPKAMIMKSRTHNTGTSIQTDGKNFVEAGNPRSEAEWKGALRELEGRGLVLDRRGTGDIFYVTDAGFRIAELIVIT